MPKDGNEAVYIYGPPPPFGRASRIPCHYILPWRNSVWIGAEGSIVKVGEIGSSEHHGRCVPWW